MSKQADQLWERIAAFADGELPPEDCCDLLKEALDQPETVKKVEYQQQLRKLMAGCMDCEVSMRCPEELKKKLEGIAEACCGGGGGIRRPDASLRSASAWGGGGVVGMIFKWVPLAAAAALFVAAAGVYLQAQQGGASGRVVTASYIDALQARHVRCGSGVAALHMADLFPTRGEVDRLPEAVGNALKLTQSVGALDLSSVGYEFDAAGLCTAPGDAAVHVVYLHTDEAGRQRSMSLWVKPITAPQQGWQQDAQQVLAGARAAHPVLAWRDGEAAYFLVGDAMKDVESARAVLGGGSL